MATNDKQEVEIVWPWEMKNFRGSPADRQSVIDNLIKRDFPLYKHKKQNEEDKVKFDIPDKRIVESTQTILKFMLKREQTLPWMIVMSSDQILLQAIAVLAPVTFTLSTKRSCGMATNSLLMDCFQSRRNSYDIDTSDAILEDLQRCSFLSWENPTESVIGLSKQSERFASFLRYRLRHKLFTLFVIPYTKWVRGKTLKDVLALVESNLGTATAGMLMHITDILDIRATVELPEPVVLQV